MTIMHGNPSTADDESLGPVDPDIALITDYLANELPPHVAAAVKGRLVDDAAFFEKVAPLLRLSLLRPRVHPAAVINLAGERTKRRRWLNRAHERRGLLRVAGLAVVVLSGGTLTGFKSLASAATAAVADARRTTIAPNARVYETQRGETRTFTLEDGSRIILRPYSQFTTRPKDYGIIPGTIATLKGEAVIEVARSRRPIFLGTAAGGAILLKGSFAVRCERGCPDMKVTVGTGHGWVLGGTGTGFVYVWPGIQARRPADERWREAERVHGYQYPVVTP